MEKKKDVPAEGGLSSRLHYLESGAELCGGSWLDKIEPRHKVSAPTLLLSVLVLLHRPAVSSLSSLHLLSAQ